MKLIVAGGRDFHNMEYMAHCLQTLVDANTIPEEPTLICGMANGADMLAYTLWQRMIPNAPIIQMPAEWNLHGRFDRSAGYKRNAEMGQLADAAVCFWDQNSRGTKHMIDIMFKLNKPCWVYHYSN